MSGNPDDDGKRTGLATGALLLLPVLCCGLPLMITAGVLGTVGTALGNPWVIGLAVVLLAGLVTMRLRRRSRPGPPPTDQEASSDRKWSA